MRECRWSCTSGSTPPVSFADDGRKDGCLSHWPWSINPRLVQPPGSHTSASRSSSGKRPSRSAAVEEDASVPADRETIGFACLRAPFPSDPSDGTDAPASLSCTVEDRTPPPCAWAGVSVWREDPPGPRPGSFFSTGSGMAGTGPSKWSPPPSGKERSGARQVDVHAPPPTSCRMSVVML